MIPLLPFRALTTHLCCFHLCRASQLCTSPGQPGDVSGPKCGVQVWGPWWPSSHRALEERRWWPAQRKVWLINRSPLSHNTFLLSLCLIHCLLFSISSADSLNLCKYSFCVCSNIRYIDACFNPDTRFVRTTPWRSAVWPQLMSALTAAWWRTWWARQRHRPHSPSTVRQNTVMSISFTLFSLPNTSFTAPWTAILNYIPFRVTVQLDSNAI